MNHSAAVVVALTPVAAAGPLEWIGGDPYSADPIPSYTNGKVSFAINDIAGVDGLGDPHNNFLYIDLDQFLTTLTDSDVRITGIGWNTTLTTAANSLLSDASALLYASSYLPDGVHQGLVLSPAFGTDTPGSGTFASGGVIDLSENGVPDFTLPQGVLVIEFFERNVDAPGVAETFWGLGLELEVDYYPGPTPGSLAALGVAGLICCRRRR